MALFSVHLMTYNSEKHIAQTLDSLLQQQVNFDYEIVVGDDCSTDNTLKIIETYAADQPNIFKIKKNDQRYGILKNFKSTLDRCSGDFVLPLAGDDYIHEPLALQIMYDALVSNEAVGFIDCGFNTYYDASKKLKLFSNREHIKISKQAYIEKALLGGIPPLGFCFNKKQLLKFVDFDFFIDQGIQIDDYPILVELLKNTEFDRIEKSLLTYRSHSQSYSHQRNLKKQVASKMEMLWLFKYFSNKYGFKKSMIEAFEENHHQELLFLAAYFSDKDLGKETFRTMKHKTVKDYLHYLISQNKLLRKLASLA
jgi:glycosyltransferase involved in cell wall biosynthesis